MLISLLTITALWLRSRWRGASGDTGEQQYGDEGAIS